MVAEGTVQFAITTVDATNQKMKMCCLVRIRKQLKLEKKDVNFVVAEVEVQFAITTVDATSQKMKTFCQRIDHKKINFLK